MLRPLPLQPGALSSQELGLGFRQFRVKLSAHTYVNMYIYIYTHTGERAEREGEKEGEGEGEGEGERREGACLLFLCNAGEHLLLRGVFVGAGKD